MPGLRPPRIPRTARAYGCAGDGPGSRTSPTPSRSQPPSKSPWLTLPQEDRDALSAVSVFDLTYAEAAETLGVPTGTVKSRVFRARRMLSAALSPTVTGGA